MSGEALLVGCGELGAAIGLRLAAQGRRVVALRRDATRVPAPIEGRAVDLTRAAPDLSDLRPAVVVIALTARPRTEDAYRTTYVDGAARALGALPAPPDRAVLVSSTAVLASTERPEVTDESVAPAPSDGPGRMLLAAERSFLEACPGGTVLRLSGLYGGAARRLFDTVTEGRIDDPHRWTNRIHRSDAAAAVVHLLTMTATPDRLYHGTDDHPAQLGEVAAFLADRLDAPAPPPADLALGHGRRLANTRLRSTGWSPAYPDFRSGYGDLLARRTAAGPADQPLTAPATLSTK